MYMLVQNMLTIITLLCTVTPGQIGELYPWKNSIATTKQITTKSTVLTFYETFYEMYHNGNIYEKTQLSYHIITTYYPGEYIKAELICFLFEIYQTWVINTYIAFKLMTKLPNFREWIPKQWVSM